MDARATTAEVPLHLKAVYFGSMLWYLEVSHAPATLGYADRPGEQARRTLCQWGLNAVNWLNESLFQRPLPSAGGWR